MDDEVVVRPADLDDVTQLATLKLEWARLSDPDRPDERETFAPQLARWITQMGDRLACRVAELDGRLVGMAWMVVFERVPDLGDIHRTTADIQSVYVVPRVRSRGIGGRLVEALCAEADARGIPRVIVHSSSRAIPLYGRLGFASEGALLTRSRPSTPQRQSV